MNLTAILQSGPTAVAITLAAAAATYTGVSAKIRAARSESASVSQELVAKLENLANELESCRRRLAEVEQRYAPIAENISAPASIHLNRRGQVTQLHRRGETPRSIASALGMSQGEVKLMIKLHDLDRSPAPRKAGEI